jgi:hypoxanthine-DNA glycosylase
MAGATPRAPRLRCFAPLARADAATLILGSMPGAASLRAGQYFAHPRNLFWPIVGELAGARPDLPYRARVRALLAARLAIWDVLAACARRGSLDADIEPASIVANDFASFFAAHRRITRVFFNGEAAEHWYRRLVLPTLPPLPIAYARLPSTSPAHAGLSFAGKLAAWRAVVAGEGGAGEGAGGGVVAGKRAGVGAKPASRSGRRV